tara:strand:+ start:6526 stop:8205 length:1680 start_codon:yes stop_codon:yes gene_type:complete
MAVDDNKLLGASNTNILNLPQGALKGFGGRDNVANAIQLAQSIQPRPQGLTPAQLAFQFFTNMAAEASKPGATALGAASQAALVPAQYLMKDREAQQKYEASLPQTALNIAQLTKPPAGTGVGENYKRAEPVTNEDGSVKIDQTTGATFYNYRVEDKAGNLLRTVQMADPTTKQSAVTLYNSAGESVRVVPGTQAYSTATSDAAQGGGFFLTSKPTKFSPRTVYKDGQELKVYSEADYKTATGTDETKGGWTDIKPESSTSTIKTVGAGTLATYMTAKDAKAFVISQGMTEDNPKFQSFVDQLTAKRDAQVGKPIVQAGVYTEVFPLFKDGEIISLQLSPSKSAAAPYFTTYVEKRLPIIAKSADTYNTTAREVIPRVDEAMSLLLTGQVETGRLNQVLLPFKQIFNQSFGINDPEVMGLETLQATSNFLAPKMRPVGSGSTSDMEFKAYQQAALYLGNTPEANYISLYAFKKMAENGVRLNQLETELLTSGEYSSMKEVNTALGTNDTGIFEKFLGDPSDEEAVLEFYNGLPDGSVIINNGIFDSNSPYIIKGWGGTN